MLRRSICSMLRLFSTVWIFELDLSYTRNRKIKSDWSLKFWVVSDPMLCRWGHPDLIFKLKHGPVHVFMDCTFKIVPPGFKQSLIVMIYAEAYETHVPVKVLDFAAGKVRKYLHSCTESCHYLAWLEDARYDIDLWFWIGFDQCLPHEIPRSRSGRIFFHWKQAIRQKLLDLKIPTNLISSPVDSNGLIAMISTYSQWQSWKILHKMLFPTSGPILTRANMSNSLMNFTAT